MIWVEKTMLSDEMRAALNQHIKWAIASYTIREEYHGDLKDDPLYWPGEPLSLVDLLPTSGPSDPVGRRLLEEICDAAVIGVEKALLAEGAKIVVNRRWRGMSNWWRRDADKSA